MPEGTQEVTKISKNPLNQSRVEVEEKRLTTLGIKDKINIEARRNVATGLKIIRLRRDVQKEKSKKEKAETKANEAEKKRQEATERAGIDDLTGLSRRIPFTGEVEKEIEVIRRDPSHDRGLIVAIGDLDDFGMYNKLHGEPVGDQVLKGVGSKLKEKTRPTDEVSRWGGEEFAIAMRYSKTHEREISPEHPVDRLRQNANSVEITDNGKSRTEDISLTFGATEFETNDTFETMMEKAAKALVIAKLLGKKRTVIAEHGYFKDLSNNRIYLLEADDKGIKTLTDITDTHNKAKYKIIPNVTPKARPVLEKIE